MREILLTVFFLTFIFSPTSVGAEEITYRNNIYNVKYSQVVEPDGIVEVLNPSNMPTAKLRTAFVRAKAGVLTFKSPEFLRVFAEAFAIAAPSLSSATKVVFEKEEKYADGVMFDASCREVEHNMRKIVCVYNKTYVENNEETGIKKIHSYFVEYNFNSPQGAIKNLEAEYKYNKVAMEAL